MRAGLRLAVAAFAIGAAVLPAAAASGVVATGGAGSVLVTRQPVVPDVLHPKITAAAWFQPDPLCATPLGCGFIPLPALSPYPKGTFHVGTAVGRQIARAFIAVRLSARAQRAVGGTLTVPLDTSVADGSIDPQAAKVNVCVTYQAITDIEGGFDNPPSVNCLPAAHAKYVAKPTPRLVADLHRLGPLAGVKGLALLPADAAPTTAWQIAFRLAHAAGSAGPRLRLLTRAAHPAVTNTPPAKTPAAQHHTAASTSEGGRPAAGTSVGGDVPMPALPSTAETAPPTDPRPVIARRTTPLRRLVTVGYQYPQVWLLPLALIVLIPFTLRALTKDLTRRR